jgi:hypothetical protein
MTDGPRGAGSDAEVALRAALWGVSGFAIGYLLPSALRLPVLTYDPIGHAALLTGAPRGAQMRYYGDVLWACAAAAAAALLSRPLRGRPLDVPVATAAALSCVALDVAWFLSRFFAALE